MTAYFVEPTYPRNRFNLITGSSGAGKSRLVLPQLFALIDGAPVDGKPTKPTRVAYVACDRTTEDAQATMMDLGLDPAKLPTYSFMENTLEWSVNSILEIIPKDTELCFIEAVAALVPGGDITNYHNVLRLGRHINNANRIRGVSFWGSTHTPKLKKGEVYIHTRDNVIGSSAWPGIAGTIIHINEEEDGTRTVTTMLRDGPSDIQHMEFTSDGKLIPTAAGLGKVIMDAWLKKLTPGTDLTTDAILERASKSKVSRATAFRWIKEKVTEGELLELQRGQFRVRPIS